MRKCSQMLCVALVALLGTAGCASSVKLTGVASLPADIRSGHVREVLHYSRRLDPSRIAGAVLLSGNDAARQTWLNWANTLKPTTKVESFRTGDRIVFAELSGRETVIELDAAGGSKARVEGDFFTHDPAALDRAKQHLRIEHAVHEPRSSESGPAGSRSIRD